VWAPVALKALGVFLGMLALAGVGASSLARGAGVPVAAGSGAPGGAVAAGLGVLAKVEPGRAAEARASAGAGSGSGLAAGVGADAGADAGVGADAGPEGSGGVTADGKVILNRAGVDELCQLPGVGPKRAQAIVDLRTKLGGRFKRMADLLRLKGIGPKGLRKIEAKAVLDAPVP
jgi:competence protein ComEA